MQPSRRPAPAKLNLTLEITGRRPDGYHEIRSVVTTISLADTLAVDEGCGFHISADPGYDSAGMALPAGQLNTVARALLLIRQRLANERGKPVPGDEAALGTSLSDMSFTLHKRIPAAAGLGGGSSDGAAALILLNEAWNARLDVASLHELAAEIGSDCPLFLRGGVQHMGGRGEVLEPLPAPVRAWFCILTPKIVRPRKTAFLYSLLEPADYQDGSCSAALADRLKQSPPVALLPSDLQNVFDSYADVAFGPLDEFREALTATGARAVHLCGSGPSLYGLYRGKADAESAEAMLRADGHTAWAVFAPM